MRSFACPNTLHHVLQHFDAHTLLFFAQLLLHVTVKSGLVMDTHSDKLVLIRVSYLARIMVHIYAVKLHN